MNKNIIIIILSFLLVSLSGYVIYDKVLNKEEKKSIFNSNENASQQQGNYPKEDDKNDSNINIDNDVSSDDDNNNTSPDSTTDINDQDSNQNTNQIENFKVKIYEDIIINDLFKLLGSNSLKDLSNQDKLSILLEMYKKEYGWKKTIQKSDLQEIKENSVIRNFNIDYTNISDYSMSTNYDASPLYDYNNSTKVYTYSNTGHKVNDIKIINKELVNYNQKDSEVSISYKFVFVKTSGKTPGYHNLYYKIEDINDKKEFKSYSYQDINEEIGNMLALEEAKKYINDKYDTIKDNLYTYTFIFTLDNNDIILKDYYRE